MYNIQHNDFVASHALEHTVYGCTLLTYLPCFLYVLGTWLCLYISVSTNKESETLYKVSYIGSEYDKHYVSVQMILPLRKEKFQGSSKTQKSSSKFFDGATAKRYMRSYAHQTLECAPENIIME